MGICNLKNTFETIVFSLFAIHYSLYFITFAAAKELDYYSLNKQTNYGLCNFRRLRDVWNMRR